MPNGHGIKKETYVNADEKTRTALTYDFLDTIYTELKGHQGSCGKRFEKLERRKKFDTGLSAAMGAIGGFMAFVGKWLIGHDA